MTQKDDNGKEYVTAYASKSNSDAEAKYSSYEGECCGSMGSGSFPSIFVWPEVHTFDRSLASKMVDGIRQANGEAS